MLSSRETAWQPKKQREFVFRKAAKPRKVSREEIFGADHVMGKIEEIIDYLKNFSKYKGLPFSNGAIFWGPPRVGKTFLSCYIATASDAIFVDMGQFPVETKIGFPAWRPSDVKNLFALCAARAKKEKRPVVIFADQFDDWMTVHEKDDALAQFEIEIDGFYTRSENVFIIVTSKTEPRKLSHSSLFASGRIETEIALCLPDHIQKIALTKGFIGKYPHDPKIDFSSLVCIAEKPSPAELRSLIDYAYFTAAKELSLGLATKKISSGKLLLTEGRLVHAFVEHALRKMDAPTGHTLSPFEKKRVRVHEVGHYILGRALGFPTRFISNRPGLRSLGITYDEDDRLQTTTVQKRLDLIAMYFGGTEAERIIGIPESLGSEGDLSFASDIAKNLVESGYCRKVSRQKYGRFVVMRNESEAIESNPAFVKCVENDAIALMLREEMRARRIIAFFGKAIIAKIEKVFAEKPEGVMLRNELDALLEPKLSEYHKRHKIKVCNEIGGD